MTFIWMRIAFDRSDWLRKESGRQRKQSRPPPRSRKMAQAPVQAHQVPAGAERGSDFETDFETTSRPTSRPTSQPASGAVSGSIRALSHGAGTRKGGQAGRRFYIRTAGCR